MQGTTLDVEITGSGFSPDCDVTFSGTGIYVVGLATVGHGGWLIATISIDPAAPTTTRDVIVTNPCGVSTGVGLFTVTATPVIPVLTLEDSGGNSTISATVGSTVTLYAVLDTGGQSVDGISMYITYDGTMIQAIDQHPEQTCTQVFAQGTFLGGIVIENDDHGEPNAIPGYQGDYTETNTLAGVTGKGTVATAQFIVAMPGTTTICFDFDPPNIRDTMVSYAGGGTHNPTTSCATIIGTIPSLPVATGCVLLDGRTDNSAPITFEIRNPGDTIPLETQVITTAPDGYFEFSTALPSGVYDVTAKTPGFLRSIASNVTLPSVVPIVFSPSPLRGGDCDDNNVVDLVDFSGLANAFGTMLGEPLFNPACDFDGDDAVSLVDFSILVSNFGQTGAPPLGPPPAPSAMTASAEAQFNLKLTNVGSYSLRKGDTFEVAVTASNVFDIHGYSFVIGYDSEMLQIVKSVDGIAREGSFLKSSGETLFAAVEKIEGRILAINSLRTRNEESFDYSSFSTGRLVTIKFEVKRDGHIANAITLTDVNTIDHTGKLVTGDWYNQQLPISKHQSPNITRLVQNYPNPFNPETWIPFELSEDASVTIRIFNAKGRLVRTMNLGYKNAGFYTDKSKAVYWDGKNQSDERVSSGIYFYQLQAGEYFSQTRKMIIIK